MAKIAIRKACMMLRLSQRLQCEPQVRHPNKRRTAFDEFAQTELKGTGGRMALRAAKKLMKEMKQAAKKKPPG